MVLVNNSSSRSELLEQQHTTQLKRENEMRDVKFQFETKTEKC